MTIEERVISVVSEQLNISKDEIKSDSQFVENLGLDSIDVVSLIMAFETEFGIDIPDEEAEMIQTVGQTIDYIKKHL